MDKDQRKISAILLIPIVMLGAYFAYDYYDFNENAVETDGIVIGQHKDSMLYSAPYGGTRNSYTMRAVEFHDAGGHAIIINSIDSSLHVNDQVKVRYNQKNPQEAVISK